VEAAKEQARCAEYDDALPGAYTEKVCSECDGHPEALLKRADEAEAVVKTMQSEIEEVDEAHGQALARAEKAERELDEARNIARTAMGVLEHLSYSDSEIDGFEDIVEGW
jgi:hypothetical protein